MMMMINDDYDDDDDDIKGCHDMEEGELGKASIERKIFLLDPGIHGVRSMGPSVSNSLRDVLQT